MGVRGGRREAVGDSPPKRLWRLAGGGGGYGAGGGDGSRRAVGRDGCPRGPGRGRGRWRGGGIVARTGDTLGSLPERHVAETERSRLSETDGLPPSPGEGD